jgi:hypothetical protein
MIWVAEEGKVRRKHVCIWVILLGCGCVLVWEGCRLEWPGPAVIFFRITAPDGIIHVVFAQGMGRDSSFDIATRYRLDSPGNESRWGRDFPRPSRPALGPTQAPIQWVLGLSWGVKRPGHGIDHPPPSSAEVKERVELYPCSTSEPLWPVIGWTNYLCTRHWAAQF